MKLISTWIELNWYINWIHILHWSHPCDPLILDGAVQVSGLTGWQCSNVGWDLQRSHARRSCTGVQMVRPLVTCSSREWCIVYIYNIYVYISDGIIYKYSDVTVSRYLPWHDIQWSGRLAVLDRAGWTENWDDTELVVRLSGSFWTVLDLFWMRDPIGKSW